MSKNGLPVVERSMLPIEIASSASVTCKESLSLRNVESQGSFSSRFGLYLLFDIDRNGSDVQLPTSCDDAASDLASIRDEYTLDDRSTIFADWQSNDCQWWTFRGNVGKCCGHDVEMLAASDNDYGQVASTIICVKPEALPVRFRPQRVYDGVKPVFKRAMNGSLLIRPSSRLGSRFFVTVRGPWLAVFAGQVTRASGVNAGLATCR